VVIPGAGPARARLERLAHDRGLNGRARFTGRITEDELTDLYARCLAVYYAPVDEDYGMVPLEAFLSEKPVLTTTDAGGPLEVVADRSTGLVVTPDAAEIARALGWLREHRDEAASYGRAGKVIASEVTWDRAIGRLLA
jgi:glycosyltransferase involved in cell wall biosynthesis